MSRRFLVDTSAFARIAGVPSVRDAVTPDLVEGTIAVCGVLELEAGYSARSRHEHDEVMSTLAALPREDVEPEDWTRACVVQGLLADRGQHRAAGLPDLLVAAVGERTGRAILHYDADFDLIAAVTGQRTVWVVPRGSA